MIRRDSLRAKRPSEPQNQGMGSTYLDLTGIVELTRPPGDELVVLIEQAFIVGKIDSQIADLAYSWMATKSNELRWASGN